MRRFVWCLSVALLVGACSSSAKQSTPPSTGTTPTSAGMTTTVPGAPRKHVLRGVRVRAFSCPPHLAAPSAEPEPIVGANELLLCPLGTPSQPSGPISVASGRAHFGALIAALSRPDEPQPPGAVCAAYADAPQSVLARAAGRVYQVTIPIDGCRHYQREVLDVLNRVRAG